MSGEDGEDDLFLRGYSLLLADLSVHPNESGLLSPSKRHETMVLNGSDHHYCLGYCKHDPTTNSMVIPMQLLVYYIFYKNISKVMLSNGNASQTSATAAAEKADDAESVAAVYSEQSSKAIPMNTPAVNSGFSLQGSITVDD